MGATQLARLMGCIADQSATRRDVAMEYANVLRSGQSVDWSHPNLAILRRWTPSGLNWIKRNAIKESGRQEVERLRAEVQAARAWDDEMARCSPLALGPLHDAYRDARRAAEAAGGEHA